MEKYGIILGVYVHKSGKVAWLYDVTKTDENENLLHFQVIDYFLYGLHSFHKDRLTNEIFSMSDADLYEIVEHKNRYEEVWQFIGRVVPQGDYYQVI